MVRARVLATDTVNIPGGGIDGVDDGGDDRLNISGSRRFLGSGGSWSECRSFGVCVMNLLTCATVTSEAEGYILSSPVSCLTVERRVLTMLVTSLSLFLSGPSSGVGREKTVRKRLKKASISEDETFIVGKLLTVED